jgi:hypothetical protein
MPQTGTVKAVDNIANLRRLVDFHNAQSRIQAKVSGQARRFPLGVASKTFKNRTPISLAGLIEEAKREEELKKEKEERDKQAAFDALPEVCTFNASPIDFNDGIPVGGWANIKFHKSGDVEFNGHFHVSGAGPWDVELSMIAVDAKGRAYTFTKSVGLHGTFSAGSPDGDWSDRINRPDIAANYADIWNNQYFNWEAACNWDLGTLLTDLEDAAKKYGPAISSFIAMIA